MTIGRARTLAPLLLLLAFGLVASACGKAHVASNAEGDGDTDAGPMRDAPSDIGSDVTVEIGDEPYRPPPEELGCVLIPSVGGDVFTSVDNSVELGVYQYSLIDGEPMPDQRITFGIVEGESVDGRLSAQNVATDLDGEASVTLSAGADPGTIIVRAASPCANSIDIEVEVLDLPTGDLRVSFNYPFADVYELDSVEVEIFLPDTLRCRDFRTGEIPAGAVRVGTAASVGGSVVFNGLMVDQDYTVVAVGIGQYGERAAQGCSDNVTVRDGREVEEIIDLFLIPLNPVGLYDVISHWDFREAISDSGTVGGIIVDVLDIFEDPGRGLYEFLLDIIADFVGGLISGTISLFLDLTGLDDVITDAINDLIDSSPFLSDIVTIGRDLRSIIAELEVISELEIGKLSSDFEVFGVDEWVGIAVYWRLDCEDTDPPDCGRIPIILDTVDLGLLRGEWTGRVLGYNRLDIDRHPVDFEYGRFILYILEYLVLPAITGDPGPVTLEDLMFRIFNCDGIGDFIAGGDGDCRCALGACVCDEDVEDFCEGFISLTFGSIFRGFVNALSFDAVMDLRGQCDLINNDTDLDVDALENGEYVGTININGSATPFTADFSGVRAE